MPQTIRFHLDEHASHAIATGMRRLGMDVTTTAEAGLRGASDEEQVEYCRRSGRTIYTNDPDFLILHTVVTDHLAIVFSPQKRLSIGEAIRGLQLIFEVLESSEMVDRLKYI